MAPTPLTAVAETVYAPETTKIYFLTTILAASKVPTNTELNAGKDVTYDIVALDGWSVSSNQIELPRLGTRFNGRRPGRTEAEDSSLTWLGDKSGADARTMFQRDARGYIVILDGGHVTGGLMDIYPVTVASAPKQRSNEDEVLRIQVNFSITDTPVENIAIPSAT